MARPTPVMQRTSFWLTLPLIALAGFALSFYSPRGARAGDAGGASQHSSTLSERRAPLVRVPDQAPAPEESTQSPADASPTPTSASH